ncbi:MAG: peptidyl-prolyl cis-trans isomerase [Candidatus Cyclonatronum sp.]|uniref:peptidylprolyl isomerase n=1 Tax=Cyclonatronum sp. TaxID=3024185 RepID=UPI0025BEBD13|nr:peptidylprolyl isomerase [Cyclonatronum sp.]MCH8486493.1 peptidyl-prolyl cis-trans isomerase [Cyclonatronum sp.]
MLSRLFQATLIIVLAAAFFNSGCTATEPEIQGRVIAVAGGEQLFLEKALERIPPYALLDDSTAAVARYRDQWIFEQLLAEEARRMNIHRLPVFEEAVARFERQLMVELLAESYMNRADDVYVSREQAFNFYEMHREQFVLNERHVRVHHLVAGSFSEASNARNELLRGVEWETVAQNYSLYPEPAIRTASLYQPISSVFENEPELAQFLRVIGVSEVSPIRQIGGQYHFIQLVENQDEGSVPDLDWTLDQVQQWLTTERRQNQITALRQNLLRQAQANGTITLFD